MINDRKKMIMRCNNGTIITTTIDDNRLYIYIIMIMLMNMIMRILITGMLTHQHGD